MLLISAQWLQRSSIPKFNCFFFYIIWSTYRVRPLCKHTHFDYDHLPQIHKILSNAVSKTVFRKRHNLVFDELAMLKITDGVSEILFNVLDKVCVPFGAIENSSLDDDLTYQNL